MLSVILCFCSCEANTKLQTHHETPFAQDEILPGAYQLSEYLPLLRDKRVATVVNHTSMIDQIHLVDTLLSLNVDLRIVFAPEHGFKGTAYNGEEVKDGMYQDRIPIRSLYGKTRKPTAGDLSEVDVIVFDIQDVGARFYTFISTLHYVMEAAGEQGKELIILDRPNPNGHFIDGPVMENEFQSFVGMHKVPVVYGMTIGEYGKMINGEGWLANEIKCSLEVIPNNSYTHQSNYALPIPPSPNLPNHRSVLLYPSLCFFEGTVINEGRGTSHQFQIYGHPSMPTSKFSYTPVSMSSSKYPKHENKLCGGVDLQYLRPAEIISWKKLNLGYVIDTYQKLKDRIEDPFFNKNGWFDKLSGTQSLRIQIEDGWTEEEIRDSWKKDLEEFYSVRSKYLIYP